jgi:hypothetical protein
MPMRPAVHTLIEDVVTVNGRGGGVRLGRPLRSYPYVPADVGQNEYFDGASDV